MSEVGLKRILATAAMSALVTLAATPAHAALIRITPTGFTPAEYEAAGFPTDPAIIDGDGFRLTYWGGGGDTLVNPVMLILATPTGTTAPALTVGDTSGFTNVAVNLGDTQTRYGGTWNTTTGAAGTFSSADSGSVYSKIGFTPSGSASENYANWNGATGITSWNLFVYAITFNPTMSQGDYVEFATSLPIGSYVVGYGCEALSSGGLCSTSGTTESTPFTFAGNVAVPEPASVTLMLSGVGLALARARRRRA
jgi:hypothetical protein